MDVNSPPPCLWMESSCQLISGMITLILEGCRWLGRLARACFPEVDHPAACTGAARVAPHNVPRSEDVVVAFDGSLFEKFLLFREKLQAALGLIDCHCTLTMVKDASAKGAALISCAVRD